MTNISRKPLSQSKQESLFAELSKIISSLSSPEIKLFLSDLLGSEEKIMLAKRFAAIVLLEQKHSIYKVAKALHLSTATVSKLDVGRKQNHYKNITRWLKRETTETHNLLDILNSILTLGGVLPYYGQQHELIKKLRK